MKKVLEFFVSDNFFTVAAAILVVSLIYWRA